MPFFRSSRILRFAILPLTLVMFLSACHRWRPLKVPVQQALASAHPNPVRLTLSDERVRMELLSGWRVESDTIFGAATKSGSGVAINIGEVESVRVREAEPLGTVLVILGAGVVALGVLFVTSAGGPGS